MKFLFIAVVVAFLAFLPVYLMDALLMPQVNALHETYVQAQQVSTNLQAR